MENMSLEDLGLLLGVIEMRMVLHIHVYGLQDHVFQCEIFTYFVSLLIHSCLHLCFMCSLYYRGLYCIFHILYHAS